ncbi:MAG TPA: hypothetical protein VL989_03605 [Candidatus Sulfotelmatobacter sp.]|nr:hypothetical protein [Candidatus Sulfotelmatobacter sp.]
MSPSDIQSFLNNENSGLRSYSDVENCNPTTPTQPDPWASSYYSHCGQTESAAQIIYDAGQAYGINPQTILATMQKEQSLVTTPNPTQSQLNCAMGYDSCHSDSDFFEQVGNGAWQFRTDIQLMGGNDWWGYTPSSYACSNGSSLYSTGLYPGNTVTFADPGGTAEAVTLADFSTAALYCYTPYVGPITQTGYSGSYNFVLYFEEWFGPTTSSADSDTLSFVRLNYSSGNVQDLGYPSVAEYYYASRSDISGYPSVSPDGNVIPLYRSNGDLCFVRLNYSGGNVQLVCYSEASNFTQLDDNVVTGYPDVANDGNVIPLFNAAGDLSFVRLNYYTGNVQVVNYSAASNYRQMDDYIISGYPDVANDGNVRPIYNPVNNDLCFVRLNDSSGNVQLVCYGSGTNYRQMDDYTYSGYPAVAGDGNVIPRFKPDGDLSFIRLNYSSGDVQVVDYSSSTNYTQMDENIVTGYPDVANDGSVIPLYSR